MREVFLSYHHADRKLAGRIRKEFSQFGFRAFLAHEDLVVSSQWRREILRHLDSCVALVAIFTKNFYKSDWTSQEVGVAIGKEKSIISLVFGERIGLRGFMESFQGIRASEDSLEDVLGQATRVMDGTKQSSETRRAYKGLAGILNLLVLTWKNSAGYRRDAQKVSYLRNAFASYSGQLSEVLSLEEERIDPKVAGSVKTLIRMANDYSNFYPNDFAALEDMGEKTFNRAMKLMRWFGDRIPVKWQKQYLDKPTGE